MNGKLLIQALSKFTLGLLVISLLIFVPAGTLDYWNGWLFMALLFIPMFAGGIVLMVKNPELLAKRLRAKEKELEQKNVIILSSLMFITGFVLAGLDYRYGWLELPQGLIGVASLIFLIGYGLYAVVLRENTYLSRTVEIQENQQVIDRGLYGIVRHPMYLATIIMFLSMPLVLGSAIAFLVFLIYPFLMAKRIKNEEEVLEKGLSGYTEYKKRVKHKLIPFVW